MLAIVRTLGHQELAFLALGRVSRNESDIGSVDETMWKPSKTRKAGSDRTLPDRETPIEISGRHFVTGAPITPPFQDGLGTVVFGMGCFWGAEREFWLADGVVATAVGYAGGTTRNPSYEDVCTGRTGHTEAVLVVYDPTGRVVRGAVEALLGSPRSHAGYAPGPRPRLAVPFSHLHRNAGAACRGARFAGSVQR